MSCFAVDNVLMSFVDYVFVFTDQNEFNEVLSYTEQKKIKYLHSSCKTTHVFVCLFSIYSSAENDAQHGS